MIDIVNELIPDLSSDIAQIQSDIDSLQQEQTTMSNTIDDIMLEQLD